MVYYLGFTEIYLFLPSLTRIYEVLFCFRLFDFIGPTGLLPSFTWF